MHGIAAYKMRTAAQYNLVHSRCMATAAGLPMAEAASPTLEWPPASNEPPVLPFRVGLGFDLHRLEEGDYKLIIGETMLHLDSGLGHASCLSFASEWRL